MEAGNRILPFGEGSRQKKTGRRKNVLEIVPENNLQKPLKRKLLTDFFTPRKSIIGENRENDALEDLRIQCEFEEIPEKFLRLIHCCELAKSGPTSESEVLKVLLASEGEVTKTVRQFYEWRGGRN